jgi:eukaryotic-like serine/threonine-protein kinase
MAGAAERVYFVCYNDARPIRRMKMLLEPGVRLGPYEIVVGIGGEGGGEVYKASDAEQNRIVALQLLPKEISEDVEASVRIEREAQKLSGLNHPHICTLHEIRREGESAFLVMEFVEGETLAKRLERGALPLDEAVKVAVALADALNYAHREGAIHANVRPVNVMLTAEGGVKLLGLGMANWLQKEPTPASDARSKVALPDDDDIVRYLAPEQAASGKTDARSDIFSFGAVFYEIVTGEKAFEGRNRAMLLAAIANLDPYPLSKTQPDSPAMLDHIAQRCLAKDPDDRWQTAHDLLARLQWVARGGDVLLAASRARQKRERRVLAVLAAAVFLATITAAQAVVYWGSPKNNDAFQFRVPVGGLSSSDIAMSPDGKLLAMVAKPNTQDAASLYVRPTNETEFHRLIGTDDASQPFWSPDSRSIGFTAGGRLKRVNATGGAPKDLGAAPGFTGGAWGSAGVILFGSAKGLYRVSAEGGNPELATAAEKQETGHFWPSFLPDGQHYLYLAWSAEAANRAVFTGTLGSKDKAKLMSADSNAEYADPGYILFHREATLFAQPFDPKKLVTSGDPLHIADQVEFSTTNGRGSFDVSQKGALVYFQSQGGRGGATGRGQMSNNYQWGWRDRSGRLVDVAGETGIYGDMDVSPDGKLIAVTQADASGTGSDIYVIDWQNAGRSHRLTLDPADDINPVWERPDGARIAFTTYRKGNADIYIKNANGTGEETPLLATSNNESVEAWSNDGRFIAYKQGQDGMEDIWILPLSGDKKPFPFVEGPFHKDEPQFSFDGKWLAYTSDEDGGVFQVFIVSFPGREQRLQVSNDGGGQPRWKDDGKELFFRSLDGSAMAVDITIGPKLSAGVPHQLFGGANANGVTSRNPIRHQWAATPNGQKFLIRIAAGQRITRAGSGGTTFVGIPFAFSGRSGSGQPAVATGQQAFVSSGLTVVRNWPAAAGKAAP